MKLNIIVAGHYLSITIWKLMYLYLKITWLKVHLSQFERGLSHNKSYCCIIIEINEVIQHWCLFP